jgi:formate dehydrogenase major subunit
MELSRRAFFTLSAGAAGGTALRGLAGLGVDLAPTVVRAQELRIRQAKTTPSLCPYCSVGCATLVHTGLRGTLDR